MSDFDPAATFQALVRWMRTDVVEERNAPGLLVGLSGTDSIIAFLVAARALALVGKGNRLLGVHFAPSEDFLYDFPAAETHLWFRDTIIPWLRAQAPASHISVDDTIDWRCDGLRWGRLLDMSIVANDDATRQMRAPVEQFWVVGTRNRTEEVLLNYSNASTAVSVQPLLHLWKSEILALCRYLNVPEIAVDKSCETDCICGRERLAAQHIAGVDALLRARVGARTETLEMPTVTAVQLTNYIDAQIARGQFKRELPYRPPQTVVRTVSDLVAAFNDGSLDLGGFDHRQHLLVAWHYLRGEQFSDAVAHYSSRLKRLLELRGQVHRFSEEVTQAHFARLYSAMQESVGSTFEELIANRPELLSKTPQVMP